MSDDFKRNAFPNHSAKDKSVVLRRMTRAIGLALLCVFTVAHAGDIGSFHSSIPVILLQSVQPGRVSKSKEYTPFTMEIYADQIEALKKFLQTRAAWMDGALASAK